MAIGGFHRVHGTWPSSVVMSKLAHRIIRRDYLTPLGYTELTTRLRIVVASEEFMIAMDDEGRSHCCDACAEGAGAAEKWLGYA